MLKLKKRKALKRTLGRISASHPEWEITSYSCVTVDYENGYKSIFVRDPSTKKKGKMKAMLYRPGQECIMQEEGVREAEFEKMLEGFHDIAEAISSEEADG